MAFLENYVFNSGKASFGHRFGPRFSTSVVATNSGAEARNRNRTESLQRGVLSFDARLPAPIAEVKKAFYVTQGKFNGFRIRDQGDYQVPDANGEGVMVLISGNDWQAYKRYTIGAYTYDRKISKLETFDLYDVDSGSETLKTLHSDYEVDETIGVATISFTPAGDLIWKGKFHVPVRFDIDEPEFEIIDKAGSNYITAIHDIPLVEELW